MVRNKLKKISTSLFIFRVDELVKFVQEDNGFFAPVLGYVPKYLGGIVDIRDVEGAPLCRIYRSLDVEKAWTDPAFFSTFFSF